MKKNTLILRSLFVFPLITSSFILSMETPSNTPNSQVEENYAFASLRERFETKIDQNKTLTTSTSTTSEEATTDSSEKASTIPVQNKWLSLSEARSYYLNTTKGVEENLIKQLTDKTFNATHSRHREILETTLTNTIARQDKETTETIIMLLATNYPGIQLSDKTAEKVCPTFANPYLAELKITNSTLANQELMQQYNDVIDLSNKLRESILKLNHTIAYNTNNNDTYLPEQTEKLKDLAKPLAALSKLNEKKKTEITELLTKNTIEKPIRNTTFDSTIPQFLKQLDSSLVNIPKVPKLKTTPIILAIDQK